jgi:predicted amidophosphoribosyltransferase
MIYVPAPLHRLRLLRQHFNQAAVLAQQMARIDGSEICVDMLHRMKTTAIKKCMGRTERFTNLSQPIIFNKAYQGRLMGRSILLVDDVMTTGTPLSACAKICRETDT